MAQVELPQISHVGSAAEPLALPHVQHVAQTALLLALALLRNNGNLMESLADDASELLELLLLLLLRGDNGRQNTIEIRALFVLGAEPAKRLSLVKGVLTALHPTPPPPSFKAGQQFAELLIKAETSRGCAAK